MIRSRLRWLVPAFLIGALLATGLVLGASSRTVDSFQGANEFQLWVSGTVIENDGDSAAITLTVSPARTQASAVRGSLAFDASLVDFQDCDGLVQWVSCTESTPGVILFEAVTATQWDSPTDLLRVNVTARGIVEPSLLDITIEQGLAASTADLSGNAIDANIAPLQTGDVNCNADIDVTDAMVIAQYDAGIREDVTTCAGLDQATQLNVAAADFNGDLKSDVVDALLIAQCSVGITNPFCEG
jgi:hypothetical protein